MGLVLAGVKMIFNGLSWGWAERDMCKGMGKVWFRFETILRFTYTRTSVETPRHRFCDEKTVVDGYDVITSRGVYFVRHVDRPIIR